jgi:hypothetical protein
MGHFYVGNDFSNKFKDKRTSLNILQSLYASSLFPFYNPKHLTKQTFLLPCNLDIYCKFIHMDLYIHIQVNLQHKNLPIGYTSFPDLQLMVDPFLHDFIWIVLGTLFYEALMLLNL